MKQAHKENSARNSTEKTVASTSAPVYLRDRYSTGQRRIAWLTLFCFFVSPATVSFADTTDTAIGNADTNDGTFTENTAENTTFDQNTDRAVIRWDVMDQQSNNTLTFVQTRDESVLNQASGITASVFRGMVRCGGSCIFANEAGITFADGSYIDAGREFSSVGGVVDEDAFRSGLLHASDINGEVHNFGEIHAGAAMLIGARISNGGDIYIADGSLTAIVGNEIWVTEHDSNVVIHATIPELTGVASHGGEFDELPAIDNSGTIDARAGTVRMLAGDLLSFAIRNTGTIKAREISLDAGDGGLVEVSGDSLLDATNSEEGGVGGSIKVLGDYVAITDNAVLDASGHSGGGEVLVGGDRGGADGTRTSQGTYVGKNTTLRADATHAGDGGKVVIWSDKTTRSYGWISARGGVLSGDGGFVETSGLEYLDVTNSPLVHARSGNAEDRGGEWLLDPFNVDIVDTCAGDCLGDELEEEASYDPDLIFNATVSSETDGGVSEIEVGLIKNVLLTGSNVTITTEGAGNDEGDDLGDINFIADLTFDDTDGVLPSTEATFTLLAANNITVDGTVDNDASDLTLNLDLRANAEQPELDAADGARDNEYFGDLTLNNELNTGGGSVSLSGVNVTLNDAITTDGGSAFVLAEGGDAILDSTIDTTRSDPDETGGAVTVAALARVTAEVPPDPDDDPMADDVLGGNIRASKDSVIRSGGGSVNVSAGNDLFSRRDDAFGGNIFFNGTVESGGGSIFFDARRAFNSSERETTHFGGRVRIDKDAVIKSSGGRINVEANLDSPNTGGDDGKTQVEIFGEIDSRVYDEFDALMVDEQGGDIEISSEGFAGGSVEIQDLRDDRGDPMIASNGGTVSVTSFGTIKLIEGEIDTQFDGTQPDPNEEDAIKGEIAIAAVNLLSLQPVAGAGIKLLADRSIDLTGGLDGAQNVRIDTQQADVLISADEIQLAAGNGIGGLSTAQVDLSRADDGLQFTNGAGDGNPLEFTIGQDASLDASNLPDADMFFDDAIDVDTLQLQSFDGELTLANIDITASESLTLGAREGINIDDATTTLDVGSQLNVEVYDSFTVETSHANAFNGATANELNITAGSLEGIVNSSDEAGLHVTADLMANESMTLRGGAGGSGDVTFEGTPTLTAENITLWAGDGGNSRSAPRVVAIDPDDATGLVTFTLNGATPAFTLRQSASIEDSNVPNSSQFTNGVDGVDYTLRSDAGSIGGDDTNDSTKLQDAFLSLHARGGIDTEFSGGALQVRGLDIGGLDSFVYTRDLNNAFDIVDGANDTVLVIRAGMAGSGSLSFRGTSEDPDAPDDFDIMADEIRLVAGDGLAGNIGSRIVLASSNDDDDDLTPVFKGRTGGNVERFVFRQDEFITEGDLAPIADHFAGLSPDVYVVHSDYNSDLDENGARTAIVIDDFEGLITANDKIILSGESVTIAKNDGSDLDLVDDFNFDPVTNTNFELEIRTSALSLEANDSNDNNDPVGINLDESALTVTDFARNQTDDEAAQSVPPQFDIDATPTTTPTELLISVEADIDASTLVSLRTVLDASGGITSHDNPVDDPDIANDINDSPMILFLASDEGNIELDPGAVDGMDLRLALLHEDGEVDFNRDTGAVYNLENLTITAANSLVIGDSAVTPTGSLDINSETLISFIAGTAGSDGDLGFGEDVNLSANQMLLQAGVDGALASDHETPAVDVTTNAPTFSFVIDDDEADLPDTILEIRQDAGYTDNANVGKDGDTLIVDASQFSGGDELGLLRLVSDGGDINITKLSETFDPFVEGDGGTIAIVGLEAGVADPRRQGTIRIGDTTQTDTDLTLYEGMDLTADEIILEANGHGAVIAFDENVLFRENLVSSANDPLRFSVRHDQADICEGVAGCAGALPSLEQFVSPVITRPVDYTLESTAGAVEVTAQVASKLTAGSNTAPRHVNLSLRGNDFDGASDVRITANTLGRDADAQFESLVVGGVTNRLRTEFASAAGESVHVATNEDQFYYGDVNIDGAAEVTGDNLNFIDDITATGDSDLVVNVREVARFDGDIDLGRGNEDQLSDLRINLDPGAANTARVEFGADGIAQDVSVERLEIFATRERDLDETGVFFPSNARKSPVATIGKRSGDLAFNVDTFRVSRGEKISVGGALSIGDDDTTYAAFGDLSALTIDVVSDKIIILLRSAGRYLRLDGTSARDGGTDIVANTIDFEGDVETAGKGRRPLFGVYDPFAHDEDLNRFPVAALNANGDRLVATDFDWDVAAAPPDLHPEGAIRDDISNVYFGSEIVPAPDPWRAERDIPADNTQLASIDIDLRDDSPATLRGRMEGAAITDDVGSDLPDRQSERVEVSVSRVLAKDAEEVSRRYNRLFGADGSNAPNVKTALAKALDAFRDSNGSRQVLGFEFRRYVRNRPSSQFEAYMALEDLDTLFSYHRNLGLTPGEFSRVQLRWLESIKPEGISIEELAEAVHPSRFIRGSDILDVFGE